MRSSGASLSSGVRRRQLTAPASSCKSAGFVAHVGANDRRPLGGSRDDPARARNARLQAFSRFAAVLRRLHPAPETLWGGIPAHFFRSRLCLPASPTRSASRGVGEATQSIGSRPSCGRCGGHGTWARKVPTMATKLGCSAVGQDGRCRRVRLRIRRVSTGQGVDPALEVACLAGEK